MTLTRKQSLLILCGAIILLWCIYLFSGHPSTSIHIVQSAETSNQDAINNLRTENSELKSQIRTANDQLTIAKGQIDQLQQQMKRLKSQMSSMNTAENGMPELRENVATKHQLPIDENSKQKMSDTLTSNIDFITSLQNIVTKETIQCDPNHHKYIQHLLSQLKGSEILQSGKKWTSDDFDKDMKEWKESEWYSTKKLRVQIINGKIYVSGDFMNEYDGAGYRSPTMLYLHALMNKYWKQLPDTDFIWYYHDYKGYDFEHRYIVKNDIPYIWCDHNMARKDGPLKDIFFLSVSRGWLKYRWLTDIYKHKNYAPLNLRNKDNKKSVADYHHFAQFYTGGSHARNQTRWRYKTINKAVFRGWDGNGRGIRKNLLHILDHVPFFNESISSRYFDVKSTPWFGLLSRDPNRLSIQDQIAYRYVIVMDGVSVRDSMIYQMLYGAVILKQLSTMHEYFYWDLINNYHLVTWETIMDLINIVINMVDTMDIYLNNDNGYRMKHSWSNGTFDDEFEYLYHRNLTYYNNQKLEKITQNAKRFIKETFGDNVVDCYMIHLLQIWNEYVFDVNSLKISEDEVMNELYINVTHDFKVVSDLLFEP